ncbi:response regulator transcription factor [Streptomyces sp. NPDC052396]|uniref:response regulator transcription factor n=1 Tax=Streptomyces sp. NPDC052396 TaxID=3365689 RepID=UPI0037D45EAE
MLAVPVPWTSRQLEIVAGMARGLSTTEIAAEIGVQPSTVKSHIKKISHNIGMSTRAGIVGYACRHDLLRVAPPCLPRLRTVLSHRQRRILDGISRGLTNKEIAREMYVSTDTVHTHARHLYKAIGVKTRTEAVAVAHQLGLLCHEQTENRERSPEG